MTPLGGLDQENSMTVDLETNYHPKIIYNLNY